MKIILLFILFVCSTCIYGQEIDSTNYKKVKEIVYTFFQAMKDQDTSSLIKITSKDAVLATVFQSKSGGNELHHESTSNFIDAVGGKPTDQIWDERILNLKIELNEYLATVWMDYQFYLNDTFLHCGVNVFQLYYNGKNWIIFGIADTRTKENCGNQ